MAGGMNLESFDQAIDLGNDLKEIVNQITESKNQMMSKVNALCDIWQSAASQHYNEEFTEVANKIDTLGEMAAQFSENVVNYAKEAQDLDARYANS